MNKILGWVLGFTRLGKVVAPAQRFLSGKKSYIAGAAIGFPALCIMLGRFADPDSGGLNYLVQMTHQPEFLEFLNGLAIMGLRAAISKAANPAVDPNVVAK